LDEIPFDADRMRLTLVHELPEGPSALCKGAPETVLPLCSRFLIDGQTVPPIASSAKRVIEAQEAMAEQGLRVIALAYRLLKPQWQHEHLEEDLVFTGLVGLKEVMILEWTHFIRRPETRRHTIFLSDYDMLFTEHLVAGVDVWINTPRRPWEACGTSGMKVLVDGGINLSELDGWWAEAYAAMGKLMKGPPKVRVPAK
jgi:hypothetical protein